MLQCTLCGTQNDDDARYCKQCSYNLIDILSEIKLYNVFAKYKDSPGNTYRLLLGSKFTSVVQPINAMNDRPMPPYEMDYWVGCHVPQYVQDGSFAVLSWQKLTWTGQLYLLGADEGSREIKVSTFESA